MIKKKSKYKSVLINKKRYYFYKITWLDILGDAGHADINEFNEMKPAEMITHAYIFSKDKKNLKTGEIEIATGVARQPITLRQGIDKELSKKITSLVKQSKIKVQAAIQGDSVRITGKKRDELQKVIQIVKDQNYDMPLQFINFRD